MFLCVYYILLQINCIITLIIHYVAHIICYVLLYIHIIILYYILKHIVSGLLCAAEIHTVSNQSPKTLRWSVRQTQLLSKTMLNIASFIPSYSDTNIILEYNFSLAKKDSRHLLSSLFIDYFHSQRSIWLVAISLGGKTGERTVWSKCVILLAEIQGKCLDFSHA